MNWLPVHSLPLRSGPDLENSLSEKPVKWDSALHVQHGAFLPTLTSTCSPLALWHLYPRALHLKLESSCPWIILSWDRFLEYPGQNYPEGNAERRNVAGSHFGGWVYVNGYFELCQYPGRHERLLVCVPTWICQSEGSVLELHIRFRVTVRIRVKFKSGIGGWGMDVENKGVIGYVFPFLC